MSRQQSAQSLEKLGGFGPLADLQAAMGGWKTYRCPGGLYHLAAYHCIIHRFQTMT